jgi:hypothetical protein
MIGNILKSKFDYGLLLGIKKKMLKFLHYSISKSYDDNNKISLKEVLIFVNKFTILKNHYLTN